MTDINSVARRVQYSGNNPADNGPFNFTFQVNTTTEVNVFVAGTKKTLSTHYTVSLSSSGAGSVSFTSGNFPTASQTVTISSNVGLARSSVYTTGGPLTAAALEKDFDTQQMILQQVSQKVDRAIAAPENDATNINMTLPVKADRLGKYLAFNSSTGNPEIGPDTASVTALASITTAVNLLGTSAIVEDMGLLATSANVTAMGLLGSSSTVTAIGLLGVSGVITDMGILGTAAIVEDMGLLGTSANVTAMGLLGVSAVVTDMGILGTAAIVEDMGILGTSANVTSMSVLGTAAIVEDMGLLSASAVITDMDLLGTSANVTAMGVLGTSANVTAMAALSASAVVADMAILGTDAIVADMAILGTDAVVADMAILANSSIVDDLAILASSAIVDDMALLATSVVIEDMGLLATSAVIEDMGLLATSAVIEDMGLLGTSAVISDMAALAGSGGSPNITSVTASGAITAASLTVNLSDNTATAGPTIVLKRTSASPATNDNIGEIIFKGNDSDNDVVDYAKITGRLNGASSNGSGIINFTTISAGTAYTPLSVSGTFTNVTNLAVSTYLSISGSAYQRFADDNQLRFGTDNDVRIAYDNTEGLEISGNHTSNGSSLIINYYSDGASPDNADRWKQTFADGGTITFANKTSGSYVTKLTLDTAGDLTLTGTVDAAAITISGATLAETISDTVGAMVTSNAESGISVVYQDADNTIDFTVGTLNQNTTGSAATATAVTVTANNTTAETVYLTFVDGATGTQGIETDTGLTWNPNTNVLTAANVAGLLTVANQSNVTGLSTITSGVWNGTAIASAYLDADTAHLTTTQTFSGAKTFSADVTIAAGADILTATAGTSNLRFGVNAGDAIQSGGNYNSVVGDLAGTTLTTGDSNCYFGYNSGNENATGSLNTFIGVESGASSLRTYNTGVGFQTLMSEVNGQKSTALGAYALRTQTSASNVDAYNTGLGYRAGYAITSSTQNTLVGGLSGDALDTGAFNVAVGAYALTTDTKGFGSVAIGRASLEIQNHSSAIYAYNTAVGFNSGKVLTTGIQNSFFGALAGDAITDSDYNVAVGVYALTTNTLSSKNTAIGTFSLANLNVSSAGDGANTAIGYTSGYSMTSGTRNTYAGMQCGYYTTIGPNNTAIGYGSLQTNVGAGGNVAVGYESLFAHTVANADTFNTGVGFRAGKQLTSGTLNSLVGANTGDALTIGGYNTAVGQDALGADQVGNFSTAIGIAALVVQNVGGSTATAMENVAVGRACGATLTTGKQNTFLGNNAGNSGVTAGNFTTGDGNVFVGYKASATAVDADYANVIGFTVAGAAGYTTLGKEGDDIRAAHGNVTWATVSDERYKKDIADSTAGLSFINALKPRTFKYKNKGDLPEAFSSYQEDSTEVFKNAKTNHGFIAQEVKVAMDAHSEIKDGFTLWDDRDDGSQEVAEAALIPILVKAIQELSAANTALTARVKKLEDA